MIGASISRTTAPRLENGILVSKKPGSGPGMTARSYEVVAAGAEMVTDSYGLVMTQAGLRGPSPCIGVGSPKLPLDTDSLRKPLYN